MSTFFEDFEDFFRPVKLYRSNGGTYVKGIFSISSPKFVEYALNIVVLPSLDRNSNQDKRKILPDRDKIGDIDIYAENELKIIDGNDGTIADKIIWLDKVYELISLAFWENEEYSYYKYTACLIPETPQSLVNDSIPSPVPLPDTPPLSLVALFYDNEQATGIKNGINLIFSTLHPFLYDHLKVTLNGQRLTKNMEYIKIDDTHIQLTPELAPENTESLIFDYWLKV